MKAMFVLPIVDGSIEVYIPEGYGTVFPYIFADEPAEYLEFLKQAFGAQELGRTEMPDGGIANARLRIGTTNLMISPARESFEATTSAFYLYVEDADAAFRTALEHGATEIFAPTDMPYGDRQGGITDPAGNIWWLSKRLVHEPYD